MKLKISDFTIWLYFHHLAHTCQFFLKPLTFLEHLFLKCFSSLNFKSIEILKLFVIILPKLIYFILPNLPIRNNLLMMNFVPQMFLPQSNFTLKLPDFFHKIFEASIELYFDCVIGHPFHPLLNKTEYLYLLIFIENSISVSIENPHKFLQGSDLGHIMEVGLKLLKDTLNNLL